MDEQSPSSLMYEVGVLKQELEFRSASLLETQHFAFFELSVRQPTFYPSELGFYQVISWLYCFYYEAGRVSFPFLLEHLLIYGLDEQGRHKQHYDNVRQLRTQLQHNLNLQSSSDLELQRDCEGWYSEHCGSAIPGNDTEWRGCLVALLLEAKELLRAMITCIREIERDDSRATVIEQWIFRVRRYHSPHEIERMIVIVARDMGQDSLDPVRICARYYDRWSKELKLRTGDYDFEYEARKLIEHTLLTDAEVPLPITGQDIIRRLGVPPGPSVRRLLKKARTLYDEAPCSKEALIERLAASQGVTLDTTNE